MGQIPPTGRSVTLQFCDIVEFRDGKTGDRRTYFDTGSMMAQLGLMSEQATSQHP
jgi:predicted ester cyclase